MINAARGLVENIKPGCLVPCVNYDERRNVRWAALFVVCVNVRILST